MNTLLDAVDALTKPDVLARYVGTSDHDHAWMALVRETTLEERAEAKKAKQKLPRTVPTGEWWCPFCEAVVDERPAEDDSQRIDRHDDPPLLDQLEDRVRSSLSDGGAAGKGGASILVDGGAFDLASRIRAKLTDWYAEIPTTPGRDLTLTQLVRAWYVLYIGGIQPVGDDERKRHTVAGWETEIRDLLDPPDQIPYMGQPCPICGETRAIRELEGEVQDTVALWAVLRPDYREEGSYGECRACRTILARDDDPLRLRARMNGAVKPATRLTQTIAEAVESG